MSKVRHLMYESCSNRRKIGYEYRSNIFLSEIDRNSKVSDCVHLKLHIPVKYQIFKTEGNKYLYPVVFECCHVCQNSLNIFAFQLPQKVSNLKESYSKLK